MARKPSRAAEDALIEAQDLAFDAWEAPTAARRVAMAKKALALSPLCADAYTILAGEAKAGSDEQLDLWRRGVTAGEAALGKDVFEEMAGHFWGFLESRPYMRARFGLATALWARGAHDEAIGHVQAMLMLNPGDNQGVRYSLAAWLAERERDGDLDALLNDYADEYSAFWGWTKALLAFRKSGDGSKSRALLVEAVGINAHVRDYLCGDKPMPRRLPPYYSPGESSEAVLYVEGFRAAWRHTTGALDWVRGRLPAAKKPARRKAVH